MDDCARREFSTAFNDGWARIRADDAAQAEADVEGTEWDVTLGDAGGPDRDRTR